MTESRRNFIKKSAGIAAAAGVLSTISSCKENSTGTPNIRMVGACGLCCSTCPLIRGGVCKGCGAGNVVSEEMVAMKNCPVLSCANMKNIAYCGTSCTMFTTCAKLIGKPYDKTFMDSIKNRLG